MKKVGEMKTIGVIKFGMDAIIFSYAAFRTIDEKSSFRYIVMLKGSVLDRGAWNGPKVASSKEAKVRAILIALKLAIEKSYARIQDLTSKWRGNHFQALATDTQAEGKVLQTFQKSFVEVQSILDQNRLLITEINQNHESKIPYNLTRNGFSDQGAQQQHQKSRWSLRGPLQLLYKVYGIFL
ncbi:protein ELF4-LIKE 4-like protein [Cinnamomum micranthum f. kanehirae]|uniref:Protein ELF4-LIKE 4-like protein n=1 Tax=Cinnamomum micranthum f. kanehirae TaxID=337451 RepID=A0A3S3M9I3_9MAGN|nr:protein ELF4-LIKE 4-like protein [Cinnamomum micranthum f. kanehirae]